MHGGDEKFIHLGCKKIKERVNLEDIESYGLA
jgi:hypothetical protein